MTKVVKLRYSYAYKREIFLKTGKTLPDFLEESNFELNPHQRKILLDSIPVQNCIITNAEVLDFSGQIFSYLDEKGNTHSLTFEATSSEIYSEMLLLTEAAEIFISNMEGSDTSPNKKIQQNRERYLGNPENCKKLDWINQKFFDAETIVYIFKIKGEVI